MPWHCNAFGVTGNGTQPVDPHHNGQVTWSFNSHSRKAFLESLEWGYNERDGVSNHWRLDCLVDRLFTRRSKKTSELRVTGLFEGNSLVTGEFPAQRASNVENVSILRHHDTCLRLRDESPIRHLAYLEVNKMADIVKTTFSNAFPDWKLLYSGSNCTTL